MPYAQSARSLRASQNNSGKGDMTLLSNGRIIRNIYNNLYCHRHGVFDMKVPLNDDQLKENLKEQIHFLNKSSKSYDDGEYIEAKRLAVHLRILLYDKPRIPSLLKQLKNPNIKFWNSSYVTDERFCRPMFSLLLLSKNANDEPIYEPILDRNLSKNPPSKIDFETWWNQIVIKDNSGEHKFSRKDVVLNVAQTDGGAHVDPFLNLKYYTLNQKKIH